VAREKVQIGKTLFTKEEIELRLDELAGEIEARYAGSELTVVAVLKGSLFFTADLTRRLEMPVRVDIMEISSYYDGTEPTEDVTLSNYLVQDVRGRHVLVVDDIIDTGATLRAVVTVLRREKPLSLATCVFLNKKSRRRVDVPIDFHGFTLRGGPFVVGYGLDYARRYRNLPYLAALEKEAPRKPARKRPRKKTPAKKKAAGKPKKKKTSPKKRRPNRKKAAKKSTSRSRRK